MHMRPGINTQHLSSALTKKLDEPTYNSAVTMLNNWFERKPEALAVNIEVPWIEKVWVPSVRLSATRLQWTLAILIQMDVEYELEIKPGLRQLDLPINGMAGPVFIANDQNFDSVQQDTMYFSYAFVQAKVVEKLLTFGAGSVDPRDVVCGSPSE